MCKEYQLIASLTDVNIRSGFLDHTLRYLHQIPIDNQSILCQMRDEVTEFIQKQEQKCVKHHRRWHILPEHLMDQILTYLRDHKLHCIVIRKKGNKKAVIK